ncbi:uncharacterized protein LOC143275974 [Babylonia areolata]|uniref:uncharacterized protein LOC143275974 n=1 Tax=Babylonia areolata TaxID=304850 RepID=UPI003FD15647
MNWKCLLVGLILVFPGTLISVEGRYYSDESTAVREQDGFLNNLFNLFRQQRQLEKYYNEREDANPPAPPAQETVDPNTNPAEHVQELQAEAAAARNAAAVAVDDSPPASAKEPVSTKKREKSGGGGPREVKPEKGSGPREVNQAVQEEPQALRQSASGHGASSADKKLSSSNFVFITAVAACAVVAAVGIVGAGVCWYKYHKRAKAASVVDYPAYGVTGPTKDCAPSPGDRKLAHSAQMYHYQHQKQQMMALQSASSGEMKHDGSDDESVEDNDDADYTVYECPGLAPTGEMEVKNPLFRGDDTPSTPVNDDSRPSPDY